ncbi:hypothetical protein [Enterococcus plantarum]|uniref:hypothetical protein n=1 Tax=Enterococcus plantarum TaxID=1077675 RepID=UPI001A8F2772|nr:hypothetical protein [Enterococcus plantarum]MBO0423400.1 hypothetical protein [Enterococcus plantarum]
MKISNAILSIIGAVLSVSGIYLGNSNLSYFGWGMLLVTFINVLGFILDCKKENAKKERKMYSQKGSKRRMK